MQTLSYLLLLSVYWWDCWVQVVEYGGRDVKVYSENGLVVIWLNGYMV